MYIQHTYIHGLEIKSTTLNQKHRSSIISCANLSSRGKKLSDMTKCDGTLIVKYSKYMSIIQIIEMKVYIQVNIL